MVEARCIEIIRHTKIKIEDHGRKAYFRNKERLTYRRIRVDGCVASDGRNADYVLEKEKAGLIIELKGRGAERGATQVIATARLWMKLNRCEQLCGLIVARMSPAANSTMQSRRLEFARLTKGYLHLVSGEREFDFEQVFKVRGIAKERK